jgi:hypothetical protein
MCIFLFLSDFWINTGNFFGLQEKYIRIQDMYHENILRFVINQINYRRFQSFSQCEVMNLNVILLEKKDKCVLFLLEYDSVILGCDFYTVSILDFSFNDLECEFIKKMFLDSPF